MTDLLLDFLESARQIVQAYVALVKVVNGTEEPEDVRPANVRLWEIAQRLNPAEPFNNEGNYPEEYLFAGDVPPPVAGVIASTTHYAVYELARQTLGNILDAAERVSASFPANLRRDRYGSRPVLGHEISPQAATDICKWLYRMPTYLAEQVLPLLKLIPLNETEVMQRLGVEYLRAAGRAAVQPQQAGQPNRSHRRTFFDDFGPFEDLHLACLNAQAAVIVISAAERGLRRIDPEEDSEDLMFEVLCLAHYLDELRDPFWKELYDLQAGVTAVRPAGALVRAGSVQGSSAIRALLRLLERLDDLLKAYQVLPLFKGARDLITQARVKVPDLSFECAALNLVMMAERVSAGLPPRPAWESREKEEKRLRSLVDGLMRVEGNRPELRLATLRLGLTPEEYA